MMNWHSRGALTLMNFCKTWFACGQRAALATWVFNSVATTFRTASDDKASSSASCTMRQPDWSCDNHQTRPTTRATAVGVPLFCGVDGTDEQPLSSDNAWVSPRRPKEAIEEHVVCIEFARQMLDAAAAYSSSAAAPMASPSTAAPASSFADRARSSGGKNMAQPFIAACGPKRVSNARQAKARLRPGPSASASPPRSMAPKCGGPAPPQRFATPAAAIACAGCEKSGAARRSEGENMMGALGRKEA
mmetsp:Transcript_78016/g.226344  ORF Transcript_78016/g.226344 Transcript_78016/m.226344 type:complete len:247 (-) Transcript_78016:2-742(-)